jgi:hypothetical protein
MWGAGHVLARFSTTAPRDRKRLNSHTSPTPHKHPHRYYINPTNKKYPRKWVTDESGSFVAGENQAGAVGGAKAQGGEEGEVEPLNYGKRMKEGQASAGGKKRRVPA